MPNHTVKNEQVIVEVSRDKMYGIISYTEAQNGGKPLSLEDVNWQVKSKGIVFGIDESILRESFDHRRYNYKYIIAKGTMPIAGESARLMYQFDITQIGKRTPKKKADGTMDFKELGLVTNASQGDVLVIKKPSTEGQAGKNVLGQTVPPVRGKDVKMPRGKNTQISADGLRLVASVDGQLGYDHDVVSVSQNYIIKADVDSSIGNVDFIGNIVINGGVQSGYTIRSGGNVEVRGPVEAATIIADGDIVLWYGIQGGDKGKLVSKGNIITKFIQNASVHADRDVVSEVIMHSEVSAGGNVLVDQGKGLIVGGNTTAGKGIYVNTLGSYMATVTGIQLGQLPQTMARYKALEKQYFELRERCHKTDQNVSFLKLKGLGGLSPEKQQMLEKVLSVQAQLREELALVQGEYFTLRDVMQDTDTGLIKVHNTVYPGVRVAIGNTVKYFVEQAQFCSISKVDGDVHVGIY
ncbi:MAG: DUF342 domain-containing protein [Cellulosilyticaceae bacterium]